MIFQCVCVRGIVQPTSPNDWPEPCSRCDGRGTFTPYRIAKKLGFRDARPLWRLLYTSVRQKTAVKILDGITEMFR